MLYHAFKTIIALDGRETPLCDRCFDAYVEDETWKNGGVVPVIKYGRVVGDRCYECGVHSLTINERAFNGFSAALNNFSVVR